MSHCTRRLFQDPGRNPGLRGPKAIDDDVNFFSTQVRL